MQRKVGMAMLALVPSIVLSNGWTCTHVDDGSSGQNNYNYGNTNWPVQVGSYQECIALCESLGDDCPQGDYYPNRNRWCYLYSNSGPNTCNPCTPGGYHFVCSTTTAGESFAPTVAPTGQPTFVPTTLPTVSPTGPAIGGRTCTHVDDGSSGQNNYNYGNTNWPVQLGSYQECIALCESLGDDCPQGDYYPNRNGECYLYSNSGPNTCNPCTPGEDHFVCTTTTAENEGFVVTSGHQYCEVDENGCVHDGRDGYANYEDCTFEFRGDALLYAVDFDIERHQTCAWDWLKVDGKGKYCGNEFPAMLVSGVTTFTFHTDYSVTRRGFHICVQSWNE